MHPTDMSRAASRHVPYITTDNAREAASLKALSFSSGDTRCGIDTAHGMTPRQTARNHIRTAMPQETSCANYLVNCINSTAMPSSSTKAMVSSGEQTVLSMSTLLPAISASRSSTS